MKNKLRRSLLMFVPRIKKFSYFLNFYSRLDDALYPGQVVWYARVKSVLVGLSATFSPADNAQEVPPSFVLHHEGSSAVTLASVADHFLRIAGTKHVTRNLQRKRFI